MLTKRQSFPPPVLNLKPATPNALGRNQDYFSAKTEKFNIITGCSPTAVSPDNLLWRQIFRFFLHIHSAPGRSCMRIFGCSPFHSQP